LIENLHNNIEELYLGYHFDLELNNLPNSIKIIKFNVHSKYKKELNNLSESLEVLELPKKYSTPITNVNPDCKIIKPK
jgi:hypothetical protein